MNAPERPSLTGDALTDALVPIAQRFIGAVRDHDASLIDELLAEVILVTGGRCDPGAAMAIVCAAMVPDDREPSTLLSWRRTQAEYQRLVNRGVSPQIARQLMNHEQENAA